MKQQRFHFKMLTILIFGLFVLLAVYGSYSVITYGNRWFSSTRNPRVRAQKERVLAGDILDRSGIVLAHTESDGKRVYAADEATRRAVVHVVGDTGNNVSNSVESFQTTYLYGFQASWPELVGNLLSGEKRRGDTLTLTIDSALCRAITQSWEAHENTAGKNGAAVVMNYQTGEILAEVSLPGFDPMNITADVKASAASPFWNRATQALYPPGSTFKTITTVSALENLPDIESLQFDCLRGALDFGDHFISDYDGEVHHTIDLKEGYAESCNKLYATLALNLGNAKLLRTAEDFGFNDNFLFHDLVVENSVFPVIREGTATGAELQYAQYMQAATGFGQGAIVATPLHMCMVAAAVANNGVMMEPRLLHRVTSAGGIVRTGLVPKVYRTAMTADLAATMQTYMRGVVTSGTGRRAAVTGMTICGKTGTADSTADGKPVTYGWFIGYCADEATPYALAIVVEDLNEKTAGGSTAALIAHDIFAFFAPDAK